MRKTDRAILVSKREEIKRLKKRLKESRWYHIRSIIYVHGRSNLKDIPCECGCNSTIACVIRKEIDLDLLIDPVRKQRKLRHEARDRDAWDRAARDARYLEIPLRCTEKTYKILKECDLTSILALGGSARAGKSELGLCLLSRLWMLRGGRGSRFWLMAKDLNKAHELLPKLIHGETVGNGLNSRFKPPILPLDDDGTPALAISYPTSPRQTDQTVELIDGSLLQLRYAAPLQAKAVSVVACLFTEAAEVLTSEVYNLLQFRILDANGVLIVDTTHKGTGHWINSEVYTLCQREKDRAELKENYEMLARWENFHILDNVWISADEAEKVRDRQGDKTIREREWDGIASDEYSRLWKEVFNETTKPFLLFDEVGFEVPVSMGQDITRAASRRVFRHPHDWVCGMDLNKNPWTAIVCKVIGDPLSPRDWTIVVFDAVQLWEADSFSHSEKMCKVHNGLFQQAGIIADKEAFYTSNPSRTRGRPDTLSWNAYAELGFEVQPPTYTKKNKKPCNPTNQESYQLLKKMFRSKRILINGRAQTLIHSLENQLNAGDGTAYKVPGKASDRLSSSVDALRYLCWAFFGELEKGKQKKIQVVKR